MGSDDGKKRRPDRPSWCLALICFCVVAPLLVLKQRLEASRSETLLQSMLTKRPPKITLTHNLRERKTDCSGMTPLRARLMAIAAMRDPEQALAALDADPLGLKDINNASDWVCPKEEGDRLLRRESCGRGPSVEAEWRLKRQKSGTALWFEHLSKAGGTSFCKFARQNFGFQRTPSYYCMPSDGAQIKGTDGRVGRWRAEKIVEYLKRTGHLVLSNEWDSFPADTLGLTWKNSSTSPLKATLPDSLVLAAVVRDPLDRLLSAFQFWGVLHNPSKIKPDVAKWLDLKDKSARRRPHRKFPDDFLSQVARSNFAVWKFSSSTDPLRFDDCRDQQCEQDALNVALDTLERFHIPVPTTWQSFAGPLYARIGFTKLHEIHVVPSGTAHNSKARDNLPSDLYKTLRHQNIPDLILFAFVKRAFLERLHCPRTKVLDEPDW